MEIHLQHKAKKDLHDIWLYSRQEWGEAQADQYFNELNEAMQKIGQHPHIGTACDYIRLGYRHFQIKKHLVFYRIQTNHIRIIRVLHKRMDYKNQLH